MQSIDLKGIKIKTRKSLCEWIHFIAIKRCRIRPSFSVRTRFEICFVVIRYVIVSGLIMNLPKNMVHDDIIEYRLELT